MKVSDTGRRLMSTAAEKRQNKNSRRKYLIYNNIIRLVVFNVDYSEKFRTLDEVFNVIENKM